MNCSWQPLNMENTIKVQRIYEIEGGATVAEAIACLPCPATGDTVRWTRHYSNNGIDLQEVRELTLQVDAATGDVYWSDRLRAEGGRVARQPALPHQ